MQCAWNLISWDKRTSRKLNVKVHLTFMFLLIYQAELWQVTPKYITQFSATAINL